MWKTRKVEDKEHLQYVSGQAPLFRGLPEVPSDPNRRITRRADPHHLPHPKGKVRRKTCDLFVIPLDREKHDWIHSYEGNKWETDNLILLYNRAAKYAYVNNRISAILFGKVQRVKTIDELAEWADEVLEAGQDRG